MSRGWWCVGAAASVVSGVLCVTAPASAVHEQSARHLESAATRVAHSSSASHVVGDVNGDGYADLVVGNGGLGPNAGTPTRGYVTLFFGMPSGGVNTSSPLTITPHQVGLIPPSPSSIPWTPEFGRSIGVGDFNHDGYADIAIGAPGVAKVVLVYGSSAGPDVAHAQILSEATPGVAGPGNPPHVDGFGSSLAAGDVNGDGVSDLVVGVPMWPKPRTNEGAIIVFDGSRKGLTGTASRLFTPASLRLSGKESRWGATLIVGHFNRGRFADIAVGSPRSDTDHIAGSGRVDVLYGSATGVTARHTASFMPGMPGVPGPGGGGVGAALATGDLTLDGLDDLAVGAPAGPGAVIILYAGKHGLSTHKAQRWTENSKGVPGAASHGPHSKPGYGFGTSLAIIANSRTHPGLPTLYIGTPAFLDADVADATCNLGGIFAFRGSVHGVTTDDLHLLLNPDFTPQYPNQTGCPSWGEYLGGTDYAVASENQTSFTAQQPGGSLRILHDGGSGPYGSTLIENYSGVGFQY